MKKKTLRETNPYLKDPVMREKLISRSVRSSCAVEGIILSDRVGKIEIPRRKKKRIYKRLNIKPHE